MIKVGLTLLLPLLLLLASCSTLPTSGLSPPINQIIPFQTRQNQLALMNQWHINGRMAIRTPQKSVSADIRWQQRQPPNNYHIIVFGALGVSVMEIKGFPHHVELIESNHHRFVATTPETLLLQQTGWYIPISALYYWIRGIPSPSGSPQITLDHYQRIKTLQQYGWHIEYNKYGSLNGMDVPTLITITGNSIQLKLFISQWHG